MNNQKLNTDGSNSRATDPQTSKHAQKSETLDVRIVAALRTYGPQTCWELVGCLNKIREDMNHDPYTETREITIDSVSTQMRPLCRKGEVHEVGTKENTVRNTGNQVICWAVGPSKDYVPGRSMPVLQTGPRKRKSFFCFLPEDIEAINKSVAGDLEHFTSALNVEIMKRIT